MTWCRSRFIEQVDSVWSEHQMLREGYDYISESKAASKGYSDEQRIQNNKLAHILNQWFVVRLNAVCEESGLFPSGSPMPSSDDVEKKCKLLRKLGNNIAHGSRGYLSGKSGEDIIKLMKDLGMEPIRRDPDPSRREVNLDRALVLFKILDAVKKYAQRTLPESRASE